METNKWHFPLIDPIKYHDLTHYLDHIVEEIKEFQDENDPELKRKEAVDILHAAETFIRKYFDRVPGESFDEVRDKIIKKNDARGYYST